MNTGGDATWGNVTLRTENHLWTCWSVASKQQTSIYWDTALWQIQINLLEHFPREIFAKRILVHLCFFSWVLQIRELVLRLYCLKTKFIQNLNLSSVAFELGIPHLTNRVSMLWRPKKCRLSWSMNPCA